MKFFVNFSTKIMYLFSCKYLYKILFECINQKEMKTFFEIIDNNDQRYWFHTGNKLGVLQTSQILWQSYSYIEYLLLTYIIDYKNVRLISFKTYFLCFILKEVNSKEGAHKILQVMGSTLFYIVWIREEKVGGVNVILLFVWLGGTWQKNLKWVLKRNDNKIQ